VGSSAPAKKVAADAAKKKASLEDQVRTFKYRYLVKYKNNLKKFDLMDVFDTR
jgi:hypothetical protein